MIDSKIQEEEPKNFNLLKENIDLVSMQENNTGDKAYLSTNLQKIDGISEVLQSYKEINQQIKQESTEELITDNNTPTLPDYIFEKLPVLLKEACSVFNEKRERDVFLTGAIGVLSGCFSNVSGIYDGANVYPNLYCFVIAPPASGKGVLKYARKLPESYHKELCLETNRLRDEYNKQLQSYYKRNKGEFLKANKPKEPTQKLLFIPANSSLSRIIEHLVANDGSGIICETEADIMGDMQKMDWGNYSSLLRLAFHHEPYALSRKTNNEFSEVQEPKISVILTGTPSQLPNLIYSVQDGLFSRFLFYTYLSEYSWRNPLKNSQVNFDKHFNTIAQDVHKTITYLQKYPTRISLSDEQSKEFNDEFEKKLPEIVNIYGDNAASIVYRQGLITFRICMILTALNKFENGDLSENLLCSDKDFEVAFALSKTYLHHSLRVFNSLKKENRNPYSNQNKIKVFNDLPDEFTRKEAISLAVKYNISERAMDLTLKTELGKTITKIRAGIYRKMGV